jgi:hypothetical protein
MKYSRVMNVAAALAATLFVIPVAAAAAQNTRAESEVERDARLLRSSAGLRVGSWAVRGLRDASGGAASTLPAVEGWYQRGLDRHVALESSVAFWGREETLMQAGTITQPETREKVATYIIPMLTSVALHPFTGPEQAIEPFIRAGGGLALGIEQRSGTGGTLFGSGGDGTSMIVGFALQGGAGISWRFSQAFGATAGANYRWTRFSGEVAGRDAYRGAVLDVGLSYRFQYR